MKKNEDKIFKSKISRLEFLKTGGKLVAASCLPLSLIEMSCKSSGRGSVAGAGKFTFAFISDSHLTQIKGNKFVKNFDKGIDKAIAAVNFMIPKPDFVVYGGDLAQLGKKAEIDHGLEKMAKVKSPVKWMIGEHDYYLDMGEYWQKKVSKLNYSFDHKGVHFIVLNSILTYDKWIKKWKTPMERMLMMARLDNPQGSPFMVGKQQIDWLKKDLAKVDKNVPLVVLSHSPLYKIFKEWNFWTDDAEQVQAALRSYKNVTVIHGHVHQVLYNQIGNISFYALMSTAWPWPYPSTYTQKKSMMPKITVGMNRADPFHERDGTGWSFVNTDNGLEEKHYKLWNNSNRVVAYDKGLGHPADKKFQDPPKRILPQKHY
ncbi:metallophosphoesterase family protein [Spirochaetota bacterium]